MVLTHRTRVGLERLRVLVLRVAHPSAHVPPSLQQLAAPRQPSLIHVSQTKVKPLRLLGPSPGPAPRPQCLDPLIRRLIVRNAPLVPLCGHHERQVRNEVADEPRVVGVAIPHVQHPARVTRGTIAGRAAGPPMG